MLAVLASSNVSAPHQDTGEVGRVCCLLRLVVEWLPQSLRVVDLLPLPWVCWGTDREVSSGVDRRRRPRGLRTRWSAGEAVGAQEQSAFASRVSVSGG